MADEGMNHLARVIHDRIGSTREAYSNLLLDFGVIQNDYSLLTNTYPIPIPKTDYLVLRQLTLGDTEGVLTKTQSAGSHTHDTETPHAHDVLIPEKMRWIKSGDRVLVAWVQHDAIVLDIILPATVIG